MLYQEAKHVLKGSKVKEIATGEIYVVERVEDKKQVVLIYGREERTRRPKCFDHRKVVKVSLIREMHQMIADKSLYDWKREVPALYEMLQYKEKLWSNPKRTKEIPNEIMGLTREKTDAAVAFFERVSSYLNRVFPETEKTGGRIESPLVEIPAMLAKLKEEDSGNIVGKLYLKCDSLLPIAGSIKARGGIYEVLLHAEEIAVKCGMFKKGEDYEVFAEERFRELFSNYTVAVGSTGNLGLSIGIMAAKLGFRAVVHMSRDAREWKKELLRERGVTVIEYDGDYGTAVAEGRKAAAADERCYFIDDENSEVLFLGYAAAAEELARQLRQMEITVDAGHALFVYLPCGVGGGPGGVTFGLKQIFGKDVHCFFAEPTHAPCMMLGLATGYHDRICVQDFGLDNRTKADGLAVGRSSGFAGAVMEPLLDGCYTVSDEKLFAYLKQLSVLERINLEPSALAGMRGPYHLFGTKQGSRYLEENGLKGNDRITHVVWATGGGMVPENVLIDYGAIVPGRELRL